MDFDNDTHNFTIRFDSSDGNRSLEMNFNELFLDDILNQFRDFLRGCGYEIDGHIQVVPSEHEDVYVGTDDYLVSDESMMTARKMAENVIDAIDETFDKFQPRHAFEFIKVEPLDEPLHFVKHVIAQ